jgi:ribosomal protein L7/L12
VKLLKEVTGYGLREAKDLADTFDNDINKVVEFEILPSIRKLF